jgi:hypothetical protein
VPAAKLAVLSIAVFIMDTALYPIAPAPVPVRRIRVPKLFSRAAAPSPVVDHVPDLHFVESGASMRIVAGFFRKLGASTLRSPVGIRGQKADEIPPLNVIGQAMGFGDERSQRLLRHHHDRRVRRAWTITLVYYVGAVIVLFILPVEASLFWGMGPGGESLPLRAGRFLADVLGRTAVSFVTIAMFIRIAGLLLDRYFAEALCATHALYLLTDLQREDVLARSDRRRDLVDRFDGLARAAQLLALRYTSSDPGTRIRVQRHFREMASYVGERRMWAVTPVDTTLDDLKRDMRELTRIFITGSYGKHGWAPEPAAEPPAPLARWKSFARGTGKAVGLLAPPAGMLYLLAHPQTLGPLGSSVDVIGLIFVAWLLLAVDSVLELGVVSGVVGLAKSIKELR